jgi:hypothetical protein
MEYWNVGIMGKPFLNDPTLLTQHSTIPFFHCSNLPFFHYSTFLQGAAILQGFAQRNLVNVL